ncbi:MAG TPA: hypothetical protein VLV16_14055 [Gemmatimonadales bacterium]|nr:hypothetical protein [Gemmatimonadales bacterium]
MSPRAETGLATGKRIVAFLVGAFAPAALVAGATLRNDPYAMVALEATIVGTAGAWGVSWYRLGGAYWRWILFGGWWLGALVTIVIAIGQARLAGGVGPVGVLETRALAAILDSGFFAVSFRMLAFAFTGAPAAVVAPPPPTRVL